MVCLRKRKPDGVSTSVLSVKSKWSSNKRWGVVFWLRARLLCCSEEVEGYLLPPTPTIAGVERAPEEQSRGIREQTVGVEKTWRTSTCCSSCSSGTASSWRSAADGLATAKSVVLVADPLVFAPTTALLDRGEPCDSCQDTKPPSQDRQEDRQERRAPANHHWPDSACSVLPHRCSSWSEC